MKRNALPFLLTGAAGAATVYFLDPDSGRRRRALVRDRSGAMLRRGSRQLRRLRRKTSSEVYGFKQKATHLWPEESAPANDETLTQRVESEIFRDPKWPKGEINIQTDHGIVSLRGELSSRGDIERLEAAVRKVPGVRDVENLLHLPNTPAPNKLPALEASDGARHIVH